MFFCVFLYFCMFCCFFVFFCVFCIFLCFLYFCMFFCFFVFVCVFCSKYLVFGCSLCFFMFLLRRCIFCLISCMLSEFPIYSLRIMLRLCDLLYTDHIVDLYDQLIWFYRTSYLYQLSLKVWIILYVQSHFSSHHTVFDCLRRRVDLLQEFVISRLRVQAKRMFYLCTMFMLVCKTLVDKLTPVFVLGGMIAVQQNQLDFGCNVLYWEIDVILRHCLSTYCYKSLLFAVIMHVLIRSVSLDFKFVCCMWSCDQGIGLWWHGLALAAVIERWK